MSYAEVIVDLSAEDTDRAFTYRVPCGMDIREGMRALVPFGRLSRDGWVVKLKDEADIDENRLRDIIKPLESEPSLLPPLLALAREIAEKSRCTLAQALRLMLPSEMRAGRGREKMISFASLRVPYPEAAARTRGARRELIDALKEGEAPVASLPGGASSALALEKRGLITITRRPSRRNPYSAPVQSALDPTLTGAQEEALSELLPAIDRGAGAFLLFGVTGSGKTEVFIRAARRALEIGKSVIVLVPEIVLTPQMVEWFRARLGDGLAVLHSRLTAGEKCDEWRRIRAGEAKVVIGARSAVFAPVENLGLIVADEEHETSYQTDRRPAYDAREIALSRAKREGAALVLASATPSILTFARARRGDYTLLELPGRVNGRPLPKVTLVDMREELRLGNKGVFSFEMQAALKACLREGGQAMLFLNRRGYAPTVVCRACGQAIKCASCDVTMTYHSADSSLHCHYCGARERMPDKCPACGSRYLKETGAGTQRVEQEVKKLFPDAETLRMDVDTAYTRQKQEEILSSFRAGRARVLVGTQMIAKGLDFPHVSLVCAVLADLTLNLPDYRAPERAFQLLTQVAGRAGRASIPGRVIVQTYNPEHYAVRAAAAQDYRAFFEEEFRRRRMALYPPFTMMARALCEDGTEDGALEKAKEILEGAREYMEKNPECKKRLLFSRADYAPIRRIQGKGRAQVLFKLLIHKDADRLLSEIQRVCDGIQGASLEINPLSLA